MNSRRVAQGSARRSAFVAIPRPRRPLVGVGLVFLAGVATGLVLSPAHLLAGALSFAAAGCSIAIPRRRRLTALLLFSSVFLAGWFRCGLALHPPGRPALSQLMARDAETILVAGRIANDPYFVPDLSGTGGGTWRFRLALEYADRTGEAVAVAGPAHCRWSDAPAKSAVSYGDVLEIDGIVRRRAALGAGFPTRISVHATGEEAVRTLSENAGNVVVAACYAGREYFAGRLARGIGAYPDHLAILHALLLGYNQGMPDALHETFSLTGTLHVFAISGLHVGVVAGLLCVVLRVLMIPRHRWIFVLAPLLVVYTLATGMRPSAIRACVMALAFWSAGMADRKPDAPTALAVSAILILAFDPLQLASMGFILSFSVVTGILILFPVFYRPRAEIFPDDPYLLPQRSPFKGLVRSGVRWVWGLAAISLACWLVSFPLTARFFNIFSPVALVGNLFVVPLTFVVVLTGFLSMVTGLMSGWIAEVFNHANIVFVDLLLRIVGVMADVPAGHLFVRSPSWMWIAGWYSVVLAFASLGNRCRWLAAGCTTILLGGWLGAGALRAPAIHALNRNGLLSVNVTKGMRMPLLCDPGSSARGGALTTLLRGWGINRIGVLAISHVTFARAGIVPELLARHRVEEIRFARLDGEQQLLGQILAAAAARGVRVTQLMEGDGRRMSRSMRWDVLSPGLEDPVAKTPCVLQITHGSSGIWFVTDLSPSGAYALTREFPDAQAWAVVEGAVSGRGWRMDFFLKSTGAAYVVTPEQFSEPRPAVPNVPIMEVIAGERVTLSPPLSLLR